VRGILHKSHKPQTPIAIWAQAILATPLSAYPCLEFDRRIMAVQASSTPFQVEAGQAVLGVPATPSLVTAKTKRIWFLQGAGLAGLMFFGSKSRK
jgi:hypothetical protein